MELVRASQLVFQHDQLLAPSRAELRRETALAIHEHGKTPIDGFYLCTGFSGHGFMHGPVSGVIMAEIILEGRSETIDVSMLDLQRFDEGRLIQEYNVV